MYKADLLGSGQLWSNDSSEGGTAKLEGMTDQLMAKLENCLQGTAGNLTGAVVQLLKAA